MARSSGRYSKYPKVNRNISHDGEVIEGEAPKQFNADEIRALMAKSRQNAAGTDAVSVPEKADVETPEDMPNVEDTSIPKLMKWIDGDTAKAKRILDAEQKLPKPRVTLVSQLNELLEAGK